MYYIKEYTINKAEYLRFINYSLGGIGVADSIDKLKNRIIDALSRDQMMYFEIVKASESCIHFQYRELSLKVTFKELKSKQKDYGAVSIKYYFDKEWPKWYIEVYEGNKLTHCREIKECSEEFLDAYVGYLTSASPKGKLCLRAKIEGAYKYATASLGWSEGFGNFEYAMTSTFSIDEIEGLNDREFSLLERLHENVTDGLY